MTTKITQGDELLLAGLKQQLNAQMQRAAEPLIQGALNNIEAAMRERLAAALISHIESSVTFERCGSDLRITIKRD